MPVHWHSCHKLQIMLEAQSFPRSAPVLLTVMWCPVRSKLNFLQLPLLHICSSSAQWLWGADSVTSSRSPKQPCLCRMRLPHSIELSQEGHSPSTGRRWDDSDLRKYLARQITWLLIRQEGWIQLSSSDALTCFSQRKHLDASSSSSSWHCSKGVFLALTVPKVMGIWRGGCRPGSNSILYSCLSQRAVSGSLFHGATLSMLETTRQWNSRLDSFLERRDTCVSLLEEWGCCHAHSNLRAAISDGKPWIMRTISHGPLPLVLLAPPLCLPALCCPILRSGFTVKPM